MTDTNQPTIFHDDTWGINTRFTVYGNWMLIGSDGNPQVSRTYSPALEHYVQAPARVYYEKGRPAWEPPKPTVTTFDWGRDIMGLLWLLMASAVAAVLINEGRKGK